MAIRDSGNPEQLATFLAFHQQAADEIGGDYLGGASEEGLGERGCYGSGLGGEMGGGYWAGDVMELEIFKIVKSVDF